MSLVVTPIVFLAIIVLTTVVGGGVAAVAFWPDGNTIVSVSRDRVSIWRAASFDEIAAAEKAERASASAASGR